jgi:hypothetical protein
MCGGLGVGITRWGWSGTWPVTLPTHPVVKTCKRRLTVWATGAAGEQPGVWLFPICHRLILGSLLRRLRAAWAPIRRPLKCSPAAALDPVARLQQLADMPCGADPARSVSFLSCADTHAR